MSRFSTTIQQLYMSLLTPLGLILTIVLEVAAVVLAWWVGPDPRSVDGLTMGVVWQVHAAFASIGFAGLAIAFQVLGEPPLSAGSARQAIVSDMRFGALLVSGVTASLVLGVVALWLASPSTIVVAFAPVLILSVVIVGAAYARLAVLFASMQRVERLTLAELKARVTKAAAKAASQEKTDLLTARSIDSERGLVSGSLPNASGIPIRRVRNHHYRSVVTSVNVGPMVHAADYLAWAAHAGSSRNGLANYNYPQRISVRARPLRQYRPGDVLFEMHDWPGVEDGVWEAVTRQLLSGLKFTDDQSDDAAVIFAEDMSALQDSVLTAIRGHQIARVKRGYEYYHETIHQARGTTGGTHLGLKDPRWFERQIAEIDVAAAECSDRMAFVAITDAERMAFGAVKSEDLTWLRLALDRLERIWGLLLKSGWAGISNARENVLVSLQNLAEFSIPHSFSREDQSAIASRQLVWSFTSIAKSAVAAGDMETARRVIGYMGGLYDTSPRAASEERGIEVAAGQTAVLAWVLYSRDRKLHDPALAVPLDAFPRRHYLPDMIMVLRAYEKYRDEAPWRHWETEGALPFRTYTLEFERYFRQAVLVLAADQKIRLSGANVEIDDRYLVQDLRGLSDDAKRHWPAERPDANPVARVSAALESLLEDIGKQANEQLANAPLSAEYVAEFHASIIKTVTSAPRLVSFLRIPPLTGEPDGQGLLGHILHGIPKDFFVENEVIASAEGLGHEIGAAVIRGQDVGVLGVLLADHPPKEVGPDELLSEVEKIAGIFDDAVIVYNGQPEIEEALTAEFGVDGKMTLAGYEAFPLYIGGDAFVGDFIVLDRSRVPAFEFLPEAKDGLTQLSEVGLAVGILEDEVKTQEHPTVTIEYGQVGRWTLRDAAILHARIAR